MQTATSERETILPGISPDRVAVLEQLERILASPHFRHSRRYPVLLRYVVEQTLRGQGDSLKERTVGVEAFDREPDYDTNLDPIVRVTAGEVRKRIAQYYHDDGRADELRIDLPAGSYVPVFGLHLESAPEAPPAPSMAHSLEPSPAVASLPEPLSAPHSRKSSPWIASMLILLTVGALAVATYRARTTPSTLDTVWQPLLTPTGPIVLSIAEPSLASSTASVPPPLQPTVSEHLRKVNYLAFSDVQALARLTGLLERKQHLYRLQPASVTTFADLREGASILIGGFDNPWTLRTLAALPFGFDRTDEGVCWIVDRRTPAGHRWAVDFRQPYAKLTDDYAIVARLLAPDTHQPVLIVAGVGENGTKAAAEFVTDPESLRPVLNSNEARGKNIEIVIGTEVVNGVSGPPRILAQQTW